MTPTRGRRSELLYDEPPLVIPPTLARKLGLGQALILQQLHYWLNRATREHDGRWWVYKTYAEWGWETCQSEHQARRALESLREAGLVLCISNPRNGMDKTLWWTIDYDRLANVVGLPDELASAPDEVAGLPDDLASAPEQYQRLQTETTNRDHAQAPPAATAASSEVRITLASDVRAQRRLAQFVDRRLAEGVGKPEFRSEDLQKSDWKEALGSINASDAEFDLALDAALRRDDAGWKRRFSGPKAAQAFAGEFARLLPRTAQLEPLVKIRGATQVEETR